MSANVAIRVPRSKRIGQKALKPRFMVAAQVWKVVTRIDLDHHAIAETAVHTNPHTSAAWDRDRAKLAEEPAQNGQPSHTVVGPPEPDVAKDRYPPGSEHRHHQTGSSNE